MVTGGVSGLGLDACVFPPRAMGGMGFTSAAKRPTNVFFFGRMMSTLCDHLTNLGVNKGTKLTMTTHIIWKTMQKDGKPF